MAQATGKQPATKKAPAAAPADVKGTKVGIVDSDARAKTRRVVVSYLAKHPKYGKYIRQRTILHVHDEQNASRVGDVVEVAPCRPISKTKNWRLVRIVEQRSAEAAALRSVKELQA
ncbi:MAG: 30S ribosomal protein S17 [Phycisphaerae bacterium]|nr:MAG: 30S ribosomal protein S17 [Phycisphaerae bacterium]